MSEKKVKVINKLTHPVSVNLPDLRFSRTWETEGAVKLIDFDIIQEALGDPGFDYMIQNGILYIEDMDVKKELDIEPQDAKDPVNIIVYTDKEIKELLTKKSAAALEEALEKVSEDHQRMIASKAIDLRITDMEKARILQEFTEINVAQLIQYALDDDKEAAAEKPAKKTTRKK